ncbi:MAG TPA: DUF1345 domain-containing protein [Kofleriaceae bacterium]|nr:DUF1345 domain-containing protein [Kofleriaceae bacterium]
MAKHAAKSGPRAAHGPLDPRGARQRLIYAAVVGIATWFVLPASLPTVERVLATWTFGAFALLVVALWVIFHSKQAETARRAAARDPGRTAVWMLVIAGSAFSLFAATVVARHVSDVVLALCVASVLLSWFVTHVGFTLRYAHLYYRVMPNDPEGGIEFPGGAKPDDRDFMYFAFTIGMCFQVSDATVSDRLIRRTVLAHALISFAYNTVIVALALNLVVGKLG